MLLKSIRGRLIISHLLPLIIVIPLVGIGLTTLLETQVLLANISNELERQANLVALVARNYPEIWVDESRARALMAQISPRLSAQVMFLSTQGELIASSDPQHEDEIGTVLDVPGLEEAIRSGRAVRVDYGDRPGTGAADILMPVLSPSLRVIGVIRLTDPLSNIYERFPRTRALITVVLVGGLALGAIVGWILAVNLSRPLRRATDAIEEMTAGQPLTSVPERGPAEVRTLLHTLNTLTQNLRSYERSRRRLLANLVHELGRPLGSLLSAIQALAGGAAREPDLQAELLEGMEGEVHRMRDLLDDLTRLYDQTLGPLKLERETVAMTPWLQQLLAPLRETALEKGLSWQGEIQDDLPTLAIDAGRMAQAVGNLVTNAVKYTPPSGEVQVIAEADDGYVRIRVKDTGVGIPEEEQGRIFDPFYRGSTSRRFPQGMGLGLSIAQDLAQAHGGWIEVESEPGKGSTFTLWLPVAPPILPGPASALSGSTP
jgi:signal transduction histidine kinase